MDRLSRREVLYLGLAAASWTTLAADEKPANVHSQLLDLAARLQEQRRARFAAVKSKADLEALQKSLRERFLRSIGGLPDAKGAPPVKKTAEIVADEYVIEKLVYESWPGYFVTALLYRPRKIKDPLPGVCHPTSSFAA